MALNSEERDSLAARLSTLNERELIELLDQVFQRYATQFEAAGETGKRYALTRSQFEPGEDKEPYIQFLGVPSGTYWLQSNDEALDYGGCPTCGVTVACVNKLATCPVCGTTGIECT